tara:strand:- start:594 stop:896 length:303 start_codon:yes stop_codon:yes gene_type:complete
MIRLLPAVDLVVQALVLILSLVTLRHVPLTFGGGSTEARQFLVMILVFSQIKLYLKMEYGQKLSQVVPLVLWTYFPDAGTIAITIYFGVAERIMEMELGI